MPEAQITAQQKLRVAARAHFCCEYCLSQIAYSPDPFSVDHIDALTPKGRATVARLQLNREGVVNLRRLLRRIGKHPPKA